jgi:GNAT superfamily N-acetyltransferase
VSRVAAVVSIRPYTDDDEADVLALLDASLGSGPAGRRTPEFFRWKHVDNPFGRSLMLVAESEGRIVGLRAYMRWRFVASGEPVRAVRAVDTATHPDVQRRGIFSKLTREALEQLKGQADLVFNTPNEKSLPGYLKMGWRTVGRVPVRVRVRHPLRFVRRARSARASTAAEPSTRANVSLDPHEILTEASVGRLLAGYGDPRLTTDRSVAYLRWRYLGAPILGYRSMTDSDDGDLLSIGLFRVRPRGELLEATVGDVLGGDRAAAARVLRRIARAAPVDHVTCSFPSGTTLSRASAAAGFIPAMTGPTLVALPLSDRIGRDVGDLSSWALTLGDVEVF